MKIQIGFRIVAVLVFLVTLTMHIVCQQKKIDSLETVLRSLKKNDQVKVRTIIDLAKVLRNTNKVRARALSEEALKLARKINDIKGEASALLRIGLSRYDSSKYERAQEYFQHGYNISQSIGYKEGIAFALRGFGLIELKKGNKEKAASFQEQGFNYSKQIGDNTGCFLALKNLGTIYAQANNQSKAIEYYTKSLAYADVSDESYKSRTLKEIGNLYEKNGTKDSALSYFYQSLKSYEEHGDRNNVSLMLTLVGIVYGQLERYDKALEYFQQSLKLARELDDKDRISGGIINIATVYMNLGQFDQSFDYYQQGLSLAEQIGNKQWIANAFGNIGIICEKQGLNEKAIEYFQKSIKLKEVLHDKAGIAGSFINMGSCQSKLGRFNDAFKSTSTGLEIAKQIGNIEWIRNAYANLHEIAAAQKDFLIAYEYYKEYSTFKDSLLNEANIKSINEMTAKYKSEKQEQQIALLEKDKALQTSELERKQKELALQQSESERNRQRAELITKDRDVKKLELERKTVEADLERTEKDKKTKEVEHLHEKTILQASLITQERNVKNAVLLGVGLLLLVFILIGKRIQERKQTAILRAEAAEFQTRAVKAETLALVTETERKRKEEMERFARRLISSQEQERSRIARELHDSLGQELLVIRNRALHAIHNSKLDGALKTEFDQIVTMATSALQGVRHISHDLRPYQLDRVGLTKTLRSTVEKLDEQSPIQFTCDIEEIDRLFTKEEETNIFRIVQECLSNIMKHSKSTEAHVRITRNESHLAMQIEDNGKGFHTGAPVVNQAGGFGLQNIHERVEMLGGTGQIASSVGKGTQIHIELPIKCDAMHA